MESTPVKVTHINEGDEASFTLRDQETGKTIAVTVKLGDDGILWIKPDGYCDKHGDYPLALDYFNDREGNKDPLVVRVWGDRELEDPTHIVSLSGAKADESERFKGKTFEIPTPQDVIDNDEDYGTHKYTATIEDALLWYVSEEKASFVMDTADIYASQRRLLREIEEEYERLLKVHGKVTQ